MANIERLEQLKRVVRDAPDDLFDMWRIRMATSRGVMRCGLGWARIDPWFNVNTPLRSAFSRLGLCVGVDMGRAARVFGIARVDTDRLFCHFATGYRRGRAGRLAFIDKVDRLIRAAG